MKNIFEGKQMKDVIIQLNSLLASQKDNNSKWTQGGINYTVWGLNTFQISHTAK